MIRVLVFNDTGSKDNSRPHSPHDSSKLDRVDRFDFQVSIAIELYPFQRSPKQSGGPLRFGNSLFRRSMRAGFALRTNDKMCRASQMNLLGHDSSAREFDVVGVRAKGEQRQQVSLQFR